MKTQIYILPHGAAAHLATMLNLHVDTIRKVCKGQIKGVCSEATAQLIYSKAHLVGGFKHPKQ